MRLLDDRVRYGEAIPDGADALASELTTNLSLPSG